MTVAVRPATRKAAADPRPDQPMAVVPWWIEHHCAVPDGIRRGEMVRLYVDQLRWFTGFYTVRGDAEWVPANPIKAPAFVYRRGIYIGPQKVGKNPKDAMQVSLEGVGPALFGGWAGADDGWACADHGCRCGGEFPYEPGEPMGMRWPTPLIQITAVSEDATQNTYDWLRPMIELGPLADLIPKTGEDFIRLPGGGRIDTVTASAQSLLGQRTTFVSQDQPEQYYRRNGMQRVAETQWRGLAGTGGRAALSANAYDPAENSVAQQVYESGAPDILRMMRRAPANLSFGDKTERRKILRIVYPPDTLTENGGHIDLASIEAEAADLASHDLAQAARFFGNMLIAGSGTSVDPDRYDALKAPREIPAGTYLALGFDGSKSRDSAVLRACLPDGYRFSLEGWAWERPVGHEMARWQEQHPGEDWMVPKPEVDAKVAEAFGLFRVGRMHCDPAFWQDYIGRWQAAYGDDVVIPFDTNVPRKASRIFDRWKTGILDGTHHHDGDPVITAHVKATHDVRPRNALPGDPPVPGKGDDKRKIDGALADMLAGEAAMTMPEDPGATQRSPEFIAL
jgi:hypothetical protein